MEVGSSKYVEDSHSGVYFEEIYIGDDYKIKDIREEEVFTIAYKIKELIDKKIVKDYKDITILLRNSTQFYLYDDIFKYLNIPLQIQRETFVNKNYFLKVLSSALLLAKIIKDKDSDDYDKLFKFNYIALARSELFNISDYEIYKSFNSDSNIFSPLIMELVEKLSVYIDDYPNIIIIDKLLEIFDVKNKIIHSLDYKLKVIEIDYLYDIASALNDLNINNLEFIEYIYNLAYDNQNTSKIKVLHEAEENSVRITNFHQSKGLEYEVLFVGGLYNPLFNASNEPVISFDKELGITYKKDFYEFADLDNLKGLSGYNKFNILEKSLQETIKEELRLLYVAFTRAKRSLYVMSVFDEKYLELKSLNHYLYLSNVTNYVDGIKRYESSLREDYYGYKRTPLKYPKELDYIKENKYQVSYIEKEVKKASAEIKELIDDEVKKRLIKGTASHEKFEFANFFDLKNSGDKDLVNFYNTKFGNKYIKDAKDFITEYEF